MKKKIKNILFYYFALKRASIKKPWHHGGKNAKRTVFEYLNTFVEILWIGDATETKCTYIKYSNNLLATGRIINFVDCVEKIP